MMMMKEVSFWVWMIYSAVSLLFEWGGGSFSSPWWLWRLIEQDFFPPFFSLYKTRRICFSLSRETNGTRNVCHTQQTRPAGECISGRLCTHTQRRVLCVFVLMCYYKWVSGEGLTYCTPSSSFFFFSSVPWNWYIRRERKKKKNYKILSLSFLCSLPNNIFSFSSQWRLTRLFF